VFDLFGAFLRYRGGEARLRDLIALLGLFGVSPATARVVMSRLRKEGWFDTRPGDDGREVAYVLTDKAWAMLDEGRERIFADPRTTWNGEWRMVIYRVPETARATREELRQSLTWLGFGMLAASTWISPHDRLAQVEERFASDPDVRLDLLRARSKGLVADRDMAERCWDLAGLDGEYGQFLDDYRTQMPRFRGGRLSPSEALVARLGLLHRWRMFPFQDPALPVELLPARWRGHDAYALFAEAEELLRPTAERAVDDVVGADTAPATGT
jgi:phenylacetic acid degradation operon negative regulatory protein